jgi:putative heme-binding domain-containing protein
VTNPSRLIRVFTAAAWLSASPVLAQHDSAGAIDEGRRAYGALCVNCHGPDGDQIPGINFSRGQYRRSFTDAQLTDIVLRGIPGTPMPPSNVPEDQAARIVSYLRSLTEGMNAVSVPGDPARGKAIFEGKGQCLTCHTVGGAGSRLGPELTAIGSVRRAIELRRSLVYPGAEVLPENRFYRVVMRDGRAITGRLLNLDTFTVQLLDSADERPKSFDNSTLKESGFVDPAMPSYEKTLGPQELADVIRYLTSLRR